MNAFVAQASRRDTNMFRHSSSPRVTDLRLWNQIYWREILYRVHIGASTALFRLHHWLDGTIRAAGDRNPLLTASGLRGLLEAAADTLHAFQNVPMMLAENHMYVRQALSGTLE